MATPRADVEDIAIVGMGCRFAGVSGPAALWDQAMDCRADFSDHPDPAATRRVDPSSSRFDRLPTSRGGYLKGLYAVDPDLPVLAAGDIGSDNPDALFLAQLVTEALRDAGFTVPNAPAGRVALAVGYAPPFTPASTAWLMQTFVADQITALLHRFFPDASENDRLALHTQFKQALPPIGDPVIRQAFPHALAAHTASRFGFSGSATVVNAGCVSALAAIRTAADDLRTHRSDLALAAALQGPISLAALFGIAAIYPLTPIGTPQPFSRDAAGTLPGEGGGVLVLRRRADAERNGERIYALIKSVSIASGGGSPPATCNAATVIERAIREAFREADVSPDTCTYVETHGSGIAAEDTAELEAMTSVFGGRKEFRRALALGTAKASIGHTLAASGLAGVCKSAWALARRVIPPTITVEHPHPRFAQPDAPFYLPAEPRPWIHSRTLSPRRAGVSAWDGENLAAHCLLEEHPEAP
jgi:acyl transferase domain-containing protein